MMSTLKNTFAPFDDALRTAFEANMLAALLEDVGTGDLTGLLVPDRLIRPWSTPHVAPWPR